MPARTKAIPGPKTPSKMNRGQIKLPTRIAVRSWPWPVYHTEGNGFPVLGGLGGIGRGIKDNGVGNVGARGLGVVANRLPAPTIRAQKLAV